MYYIVSLSGKYILVLNPRNTRPVHGFESSSDFHTFWIKGCWKITGNHFKIRISNILIAINGSNVYNFGWTFFYGYLIKYFTFSSQKTLPRLEDCPRLKRILLSDSFHILSCYTKFRVLSKSKALFLLCILNMYLEI